VGIGEHGQDAPDMGVRDRVVVEVEADIGCLADRDGDAFQQRRRVLRQGEQAGRLVGEHRADSAIGFIGTAPVGGRSVTPGGGLGVEVVQIGEGPGGEEGVAHVSNGALDPALLIAARDRDRAGLVAIVPGEAEQRGRCCCTDSPDSVAGGADVRSLPRF